MKRILFIQPPCIAGAMISLLEQIHEFQKKGYDIKLIISGNFDKKIGKKLENSNIKILFVKMYPWIIPVHNRHLTFKIKFLIKHLYNIFIARHKLTTIVREYKPNYIYCNSFDNYLPILVADKAGIPSIMHFREYGIYDHGTFFFSKSYAKYILRKINLKICISKSLQQFYSEQFPEFDFKLVYNGVSLSLINKDLLPSNKIYRIGVVGRVCEGKGQLLVAENAKYFPQCSFHFFGSAQDKNYVEKIKRVVKRDQVYNVFFEDFTNDIKSIYSFVDMIIVPSKCEAFGRIIIEAMLNRRLVLASASGSFTEIIEDERTGFLFELCSTSYVAAFNRILESNNISVVLENAFTYASKFFTSERVNNEIEAYIKNLEDIKKSSSH